MTRQINECDEFCRIFTDLFCCCEFTIVHHMTLKNKLKLNYLVLHNGHLLTHYC
jgi:hypothetical protein